MDARLKKKNRSLVFGLRRQQLLRLVLTLVLYTAAAPLLYILAQLLYSLFIWQEYDLIYRLAHWFADRIAILSIGYIGLGYTAIFLHYFSQSFSYLEEVLEGAESIYEDDGELISFSSPALSQIETQMNQLKLTLRNNQRAAQEAEKRKTELVAYLAHDLKTPIATIKSYSEAIKDGIYPYDTLEKSVDVIIEHAGRLEKKVRSLILLNKMGYLQDTAPEGNCLDMNEVIEKAILSLKVVKPEIELISKADPDICFHGEEEPWRITVENLIDNALRYARSHIIVELHENQLCVINDGSHIEEERMETLFHPYEKGTDGQFGLGLSIVYRVCTTYGYRVQAENLKDGVCFRIWKEHRGKEQRRKEKNSRRMNRNEGTAA